MSKKFNNDYLISKISALMVNNSMTREKGHRRSVCRSQTSTMSFTIRAVKGSPLSRSLILPITSAFPLTGSWANQGGSAIAAKSAAEFITRAVLCGAAKLTPYSVEEGN